jgi:ATP-dependent 26S proteasome regulatory subunit
MIEFRSVVGKTVVPVAEIKAVRAKRYALGFVDVRHARGTIHLINQMDGFHDFVCTVKTLNPAAKIEGC